jgi:hypothetical protein
MNVLPSECLLFRYKTLCRLRPTVCFKYAFYVLGLYFVSPGEGHSLMKAVKKKKILQAAVNQRTRNTSRSSTQRPFCGVIRDTTFNITIFFRWIQTEQVFI